MIRSIMVTNRMYRFIHNTSCSRSIGPFVISSAKENHEKYICFEKNHKVGREDDSTHD
jgi:hypothetical protein